MKPLSDETCLKALCQGHSGTLREIYREYAAPLKHWVVNNGGQPEDARDLMQEALIAIYDRYCGTTSSFNGSFGGLLMTIAKRKWYDRLRQKKRETDVRAEEIYRQEEEAPEFESAEEAMLQKKKMDCLEEAFRQLSEQCQRLLHLYAQGQDDVEKIASTLNMTNANAVYQARHRCLNRWKQLFYERCK